MAQEQVPREPERRGLDPVWAIVATACVVVALVAWRSTLGMSFADDGYYAAVTLRLAQGARLFVDEMFVQSLGFLAAVPFAKLWTTLFGMTGFVAALRIFYVALASTVALAMYRILRPSFGRWPALAAVVVPLLAPAYNLLGVSYDTMAALGMMLALTLAFKALRDSSRASAVAAGAAAAFASISYPPLTIAAVALLVSFVVLGRGRGLTRWVLAGAGALVAVFAVWLFARTTIADIRLTFNYALSTYSSGSSEGPARRLITLVEKFIAVMEHRWKLPLWAWFVPSLAASVAVALPALRVPGRERMRGWILASLPVALALPVFADWSSHGRGDTLLTLGGNYLIAFVILALPGMIVSTRSGSEDLVRLIRLALPTGLAGFVVVSASTSAGMYWANGVVGLAPLAMVAVAWWVGELRAAPSRPLEPVMALVLIVALMTLLFGTSFKDGTPLSLDHRIASGSYAGITTTAKTALRVAATEALASRWVRPTTGVLFFGKPAGYLLQPGVMVTNAVWLATGPKDQATVDYFGRVGRWPDVAFVPTALLPASSGALRSSPADPLLAALISGYRVAETSAAAGLTVFVRTAGAR